MTVPLKHLLQGVFKNESWKLQLLSEWNSIVGNLADKMRLEKIDGTTLIIGVYQSSWMQELYLLSTVLLKTINQRLKHPYVKRLRFKHATRTKKESIKIPEKKPEVERPPIVLSHKETEALEKLKDQDLKAALHTFLSRCHYQKLSS